MNAMMVMSALSQPTRLDVFSRLVDTPDGMSSGDLAVATGTSANTMSAHLAILSRAGVVTSEKKGRTVIYRARTETVEKLSGFLAHACERGTRAHETPTFTT